MAGRQAAGSQIPGGILLINRIKGQRALFFCDNCMNDLLGGLIAMCAA